MARVTVEDCVEKVPNRFELVMFSAQRARDIANGSRETVPRDNDKNPVIALREVAVATIELEALEESLVRSLQKHQPFDDDIAEEEEMSVPALQGEAGAEALDAAIDARSEPAAEAAEEEAEEAEDESGEETDVNTDEDAETETEDADVGDTDRET